MNIKRIAKKALRRLGLVPLSSVPATSGIWGGYAHDAIALAQWIDCDRTSLARPQQHPERVDPEIRNRSCNWYLPVFDNAFYGGIMTILRLAAHLQESDCVAQRFLICGECDVKAISKQISEAFPVLRGAEVRSLASASAIQRIPAADYSVATLWTTAYVLLNVTNTGYKFYMIQDYEPLFYPAGSTYAQAELSYRFGFHGIANTQSVRDIYEQKYGGKAVTLSPSVDTSIFYPAGNLESAGPRRLFYYARPGTPRNCFELAVAAFKLLKRRMGDRVEILCAGAAWDPADYGLTDVVTTIGMLPYQQTGDLYRSCHVGLAMMMTPHPSYLPFEMMGCGTLVVSNRNEANTWFLRDGENCLLSEPTASCLAETLADALENYDAYEHIRQRGAAHIHESHSDWKVTMREVAAFMHRPDGLLS
ncbi:glycosyltransferase family 4 protein [Rhizobium sp. RHZ01]|uniref:glycosyltransferase family 4 protein n=1 Tax=Rhizobium sp. RHZ01 TaxID=2769304 RepID=UPI00177DFB9D|nr:glycosyltransferase family 4 protein [Rhizobium sp. RHZ01]MBD9443983.1 glycosyltransferase family 4 protein [Rhizobium sp. RHZ01]